MSAIKISTDELIAKIPELHAGDSVLLTGTIYTARDAAHKRLFELLDKGEELPFELRGAIIYFAGPTPGKGDAPVGACGPTTSSRMDGFSPRLLDLGLTGMIGKGERDAAVCDAIVRNRAIYLCAVGGAGALVAKSIKTADVIAFPELGCESIKRMTVVDMPCTVAIDAHGAYLFLSERAKYKED